MKTKNVLLIGGVVAAGAALIGYEKITTLKAVFDRMQIYPTGVSNISAGLNHFTFNLDLTIKNPTNTAFSVSGLQVAKLKRILVTRKGDFLGQAEVNIEGIEIPAYSVAILKDVPFSVSLGNLMYNILTVEGFGINELSISAVFEVFGKEYTIDN